MHLEYDAEGWQYSLPDNERKLEIPEEVISFYRYQQDPGVISIYLWSFFFFLNQFFFPTDISIYPN